MDWFCVCSIDSVCSISIQSHLISIHCVIFFYHREQSQPILLLSNLQFQASRCEKNRSERDAFALLMYLVEALFKRAELNSLTCNSIWLDISPNFQSRKRKMSRQANEKCKNDERPSTSTSNVNVDPAKRETSIDKIVWWTSPKTHEVMKSWSL